MLGIGPQEFALILIIILAIAVSIMLERKRKKKIMNKRKPVQRNSRIGSGKSGFEYDIAISFAGEDREIAENLARKLRMNGARVFYDKFHKSELWGKKLTAYFQDIYGSKTRFVVILISEHYPIKDWTNFELSIMREEARKRKKEFVLPIRIDNTKMLGIHEDVGYLDYREEGIDGIVSCLLEKMMS